MWIGDLLRQSTRSRAARIGCDSSASTSNGNASHGLGLVLLGSVPRPSLFMVRVRTGAQCTSLAPTQTQRCRRVAQSTPYDALLCSAPQASLESLDEACRSEYSPMLAPAHAYPWLCMGPTRSALPVRTMSNTRTACLRRHRSALRYRRPAARCTVPCAHVRGRRAAIGSRAIAAAVVVGKCSA